MRILFLQGNATPFFPLLGRELVSRGHEILRIPFNGGDDLYWSVGKKCAFRGRPADWPRFFSRTLAVFRPDIVLLFGQWRSFHRLAINVAEEENIPVWIFDEGYIRPNRIRMERAGPGGASQVPTAPHEILNAVAALGTISDPVLPPSTFARRAVLDIAYHTCRVLTWPFYPHHRFHAPVSPFIEYLGYARQIAWNLLPLHRQENLPSNWNGYFLFPLQMDGDFQIHARSRFRGNRDAIEEVILSFAAHAEPGSGLVFKLHPLDNGLIDWQCIIREIAARACVEERVHYTAAAALPELVAGAYGVVTINSTVGLLALEAGYPVIPLGEAIYAMPGLTFQHGLDRFWREAAAPDMVLLQAFRRVVIERTAIPGDFFGRAGIAVAVTAAADRLEQERNETLPAVAPVLQAK